MYYFCVHYIQSSEKAEKKSEPLVKCFLIGRCAHFCEDGIHTLFRKLIPPTKEIMHRRFIRFLPCNSIIIRHRRRTEKLYHWLGIKIRCLFMEGFLECVIMNNFQCCFWANPLYSLVKFGSDKDAHLNQILTSNLETIKNFC